MVQPWILDTSLLGFSSLTSGIERAGIQLHYQSENGESVDISAVHSFWYRRWHDPSYVANSKNAAEQAFIRENWRRILQGIVLANPSRWVNNPLRHAEAANKLFQLKIAAEIGFNVPRTLITNDSQEALSFVSSCNNGAICKAFATDFRIRGTVTVLLREQHLDLLSSLPICPAIFQEFIPCACDVRVIVIGEESFSAQVLTSKESEDIIDWRLNVNNPWSIHYLPPEIQELCFAITQALGLSYGALDLRLTPDGEYFFLEINPGGQFLFLEVWTELPIAAALASHLAA